MSISVPTGWNTNNTSLWATAQIGVSNGTNYPYLVVIKKPKTNYAVGYTINDYMTGQHSVFALLLTDPVWGQNSSATIGGLSGLTAQLSGTGKASNDDLRYLISVLEDNNNFYEIVGWTTASTADTDMQIITNITNSFKLEG
jgi:hypothetical protein